MKLNHREKLLAGIMAIAVVGWLSHGWFLEPARQRIATLQRVIPEKTAALDRINELAGEYTLLSRQLEPLKNSLQPATKNPFSPAKIQTSLSSLGLSARQATVSGSGYDLSPQYSQEEITIKLNQVSADNLLSVTDWLESQPAPCRYGKMTIQPAANTPGQIDVEIQLSSLLRKNNL